MPIKEHVHSLRRLKRDPRLKNKKLKRGEMLFIDVFICRDPDCSFRAKRVELFGKRARCAACGQDFILQKHDLERAIPQCSNCSDIGKNKKLREVEAEISNLFFDPLKEIRMSNEEDGVLTDRD